MKLIQKLSTLAVGILVVMLSAIQAQAETVIFDPDDATKATGINDLMVDGTLYNVAFTDSLTAADVYGIFPGEFDFTTEQSAQNAMDATVAAFFNVVDTVGTDDSGGFLRFRIGFESQAGDLDTVRYWQGANAGGQNWVTAEFIDQAPYNTEASAWAEFTPVGGGTDPVDLTGTVQDQGGHPTVFPGIGQRAVHVHLQSEWAL